MIFDGKDSIYTKRLVLRLYNREKSEEIFKSFTNDGMLEYFGLKSGEELATEVERFKQGLTMFGKSFTYFHLLEKNSEMVIGWCGFHTWYTRHSRAEIGYQIYDEKHKGQGYMKEAFEPVIDYGFTKMDLHRIEAFTSTTNTASMKLLLNVGFQKEGLLREHYFTNGKYEDSVAFGLLKGDYLNRRQT